MGALPSALAMIAGPSDRRADRKAFAGSRAKDARDAKKTDPDTSKTPTGHRQGEIAKDIRTGHLRGIRGRRLSGADRNSRKRRWRPQLEAEAAAAAKVAAQDAKAAPPRAWPSSHLTPAGPCRVRINSRSNSVRPPIEINCRKLRGRGGACGGRADPRLFVADRSPRIGPSARRSALRRNRQAPNAPA
jgi:hypothetical protein